MKTSKSTKYSLYEAFDKLCRRVKGASLYELSKHTPMPDNPFVETSDLPHEYKWLSFFAYYGVFMGLFLYFLYTNYEAGVTQSFISLDPTSGVCSSIPGSTLCCEVPVSITGTFLADTFGIWDTQPNFTYTHSLYGITGLGLQYTNQQYAQVINSISKQLKVIGTKAAQRDYAWNIVSLASYLATNTDVGNLQFYSTGNAAVIFNQALYGANMGSNTSMCNFDWTSTYSATSSKLTINFDLNITYSDGEYACPWNSVCENSCPGAIALNAFGYDSTKGSNIFQINVEMSAVTTAIAVNIGLNNISSLIEVKYDNNRIDLWNRMNVSNLGIPSLLNTSNYYFSSYYDVLYAPMDPVYCITYHDINISQCLIRLGNTLVYPVTSSWGYYSSSTAKTPQQCSKKSSKSGSGKYYCNLMDILVGFIYYPNTNCDNIYRRRRRLVEDEMEAEIEHESYNLFKYLSSESDSSSSNASYPTYEPTSSPSFSPTVFATAFAETADPTIDPTSYPSYQQSTSPTLSPTFSSSLGFTDEPTFEPTLSPSATLPSPFQTTTDPTILPTLYPSNPLLSSATSDPTLEPSTTPTLSPTVSSSLGFTDEPTFEPTLSPSAILPNPFQTTADPTILPTLYPSNPLLSSATSDPTLEPSLFPTISVTSSAFSNSTMFPTLEPTADSYTSVSIDPTIEPSVFPSLTSGDFSSITPSLNFSSLNLNSSIIPTSNPTSRPSFLSNTHVNSSIIPTTSPTSEPSTSSTSIGSAELNGIPTSTPTSRPSVKPTSRPSSKPTVTPTSAQMTSTTLKPSGDSSYYYGSKRHDSNSSYYYYYGGLSYYSYNGGSYSYSASYGYSTNISTDDFTPYEAVCYDNGLIFDFTRAIALVYYNHTSSNSTTGNSSSVEGDVYVSNLAYSAMVNTILQTTGKPTKSAFNKLCSGTNVILGQRIPPFCAILTIEIYGGDDRHISEYYYQPSSIAFTDSIYNAPVLKKLAKNPPTSLIQSYYSCVLAPIPSFLTASGLAFSNATLYLTIFFMLLIFGLLKYLKYYHKIEINSKFKNSLEEEAEKKKTEKLLEFLETLQESNILSRLDALTDDIMLSDLKNKFSNFERIMKIDELKRKTEESETETKRINFGRGKSLAFEMEVDNRDQVVFNNPLMKQKPLVPAAIIDEKEEERKL